MQEARTRGLCGGSGGGAPIGLVLAVLALACPLDAQYVHGLVTYVDSEAPVAGANVLLLDAAGTVQGGTVTGADGLFAIPVTREGRVTVYVEHPSAWAMVDGPVDASFVQNTMVLFRLAPSPIVLEGMEVSVEARSLQLDRTGFYRRRTYNPGVLVDRSAIERRKPLRTTDLLRAVPGVTLLDTREVGKGSAVIMSYALRTQVDPSRMCWPRVVVDGTVVNAGGTSGGPTSLDELVHPLDVQALEVYRSPAEAPMEIGGGGAGCGLIVLWTRAGGPARR